MSFPQYPKYKKSGVEWLGDLPEHWHHSDLRWLSRRYSGGTPDKTKVEYFTNGTIPWLNSGAVNQSLITEASEYITEDAFANSSAKWIPAGALVMALAGQGKTKGMVAQLGFASTCNQSMAAIVPTSEVVPRFLLWWLTSNYQNIRNMAGGDLRDGLNLELLGDIPCPLPPRAEQTMIAHLLDSETTKLDALIAEQQRLIELLKEKRQAVISHAVTKGLDPDAPMRASGVPWIGDVPSDWMVVGLTKYLNSVVDYRGRTPTKVDDGVFLLTARNIRNGTIDYETSQEFISPHEYAAVMSRGRPDIGDVVFTTEAPLGQVANLDRTDVAIAQRVIKFRGIPGMVHNHFLKYWIMGAACQANLEMLATGSTALGIKGSKIGHVHFCLPPYSEQEAIVAHLDRLTGENDLLVSTVEQTIALLHERRDALISAAVTGKIDVRHLADAEAA